MIDLLNTTICCIDTKNIYEALCALNYSCKDINFKEIIFFTDCDNIKLKKFKYLKDLKIINIDNINSKVSYSKFCLLDLPKYINTDHCLTIQHDGFIVNPSEWSAEFLNYDYIGAPWPSEWGYKNRVGNGGFCLKSLKFLNECKKIFSNYNFIEDRNKNDITDNEDFLTCVKYYDIMISNGIKFAPVNLAAQFSIEHPIPEMKEKTFGFHDKFLEYTKRAMNEKFVNLAI